jgi:hypothetical protein
MHPPRLRGSRQLPVRTAVGIALIVGVSVPPVAYAAGVSESSAANERAPLIDAVTATLQGERVADGCQYTSQMQLAPGQHAVREDSIAIDDASCTMTVRRGRPADATQIERPTGGMSDLRRPAVPLRRRAPALPAPRLAAATVHSRGYYKAYYEDPPGIDVNSVRNNVDWYWNGSTVSSGNCSYNYGWYSPSGWGLKENNFFCRYESSQTKVRSSSYVHFKNGVFCAFIDTHTYYDRNNAYGRNDGYLLGQVSARKSGGCNGLLSFHTELRGPSTDRRMQEVVASGGGRG